MATKKTSNSSTAKKATAKKASTAKKAPSPKKKTAANKKVAASKKPVEETAKEAAGAGATIDRRRTGRREEEATTEAPKLERRKKVNRRRQIDPTTCERDYSDAEVEFMNALDDYKRSSGRMFPTCSEVLEVIRGLGYVQLTPAESAARAATEEPAEDTLESQAEAAALEAQELSDEVSADAESEPALLG